MLRGKEWTSETAEGGQGRARKAMEGGREGRRTKKSHQRGSSEWRTRMGGQRGNGLGESGTGRNP